MKKRHVAIIVATALLSIGAFMNVVVIPTSTWPIRTSTTASDRVLMLDTNNPNPVNTNYTIPILSFANSIGLELSTNPTFISVLTSNLSVVITNGTNINLNQLATLINPVIPAVYVLAPTGISNYVLDWGHTNTIGQTNLYADIDATNDVSINSFTHANMGASFSFNIVADGGNRNVWLPDSWWNPPFADLSTNLLSHQGSKYLLVLNQGNEMRVTLQSNMPPPCITSNHLSVIWTTFGQ